MPADDPDLGRRKGAFEGFHSYSDDTPRGPAPAPDPTHGGDALRLDRAAQARPRIARRLILASAAAAVVVTGGVLALSGTTAKRAESQVARPLPVEVAELEPPNPPPVSASEPLEVLPQNSAPVAVRLAPEPEESPSTPQAPAPEVEFEPAPRPEAAATPPARDAAAREAPVRSDPCQGAASPAAELVCRDPDLAAADRRMRRAYEAAVAAGVPEEMLALEQADWREIREIAASRSPRAVASIYRQRTDELWRMAEAPWR